jgi:DNA polymerase-3 subunit beta
MKFTINREKILLPLQQIVNVIEKKQTMAVLSNVLLKLENHQLSLTGSDLEIQIVVILPVDTAETARTTIPARKFLDICRLLPGDAELKFKIEETKVIISSGRSRFSLSTLDADSYPSFPEIEPEYQFSIPSIQFKDALSKTTFCMANQDFRYYLNGLSLSITNSTLRLVASDGHRMALFQDEINQNTGISNKIIIPRKGIQELSRILELTENDVTVSVSKNNIQVMVDKLIFSAKLIDATYPNFQAVIQQDFLEAIPVPKDVLKDALTRVAILSNEKSKGVTLNFESGQIQLTAFNPEHEEAEENVLVEYSDEPLRISFNGQYLIDALNILDSEIVFFIISKDLSCCFVEESTQASYRYIIMPMTL